LEEKKKNFKLKKKNFPEEEFCLETLNLLQRCLNQQAEVKQSKKKKKKKKKIKKNSIFFFFFFGN
jgi:hypothetical protein